MNTVHVWIICIMEIHEINSSLLAISACSENLFNMSGYFFSPSFPGYYLDDMFCTWHITVPSGYVIHLELQEFRLKDHSKCEDCFLQIFDGKEDTAPTIGRFCGYVYPPVLVSSSNYFTIVLDCKGNLHKARFKAFYHSVGGMCCVIFYLHRSHNTPLLPPSPQVIIIIMLCIGIALGFSWDIFMSQEKLQTMIMQIVLGERGVL